jgi:hypothetical protein
MRLRRNQLCPIHRSLACCGREAILGQNDHARWESAASTIPVVLADTESPLQCRNPKADGQEDCIVPDHISPRGMGGAWRDDHPDNIQAVHWSCNGEKGSTRV